MCTSAYNGFNLDVGDLPAREAWWVSNRGQTTPRALQPGVHGVSNGVLDEPWHKVRRGEMLLKQLIADGALGGDSVPFDRMFDEILGDKLPSDEV